MRNLRVTIPDGVEFADLRLSRNVDDGRVRFAMAPIEAICEASALDIDEIVQGPQPLVGQLISAWYRTIERRWRARPGTGGPSRGGTA